MDEGAYTRVADPKICLTEKGKREAEKCGEMIREMIEKDGADDWKVYFYVSPYRRTNETLRGLGKAFERSRIAGVREEPRLREQDFGMLFFSSILICFHFYRHILNTCLNLVKCKHPCIGVCTVQTLLSSVQIMCLLSYFTQFNTSENIIVHR